MSQTNEQEKKFIHPAFMFLLKGAIFLSCAIIVFSALFFAPDFSYNKSMDVSAQDAAPQLKPYVITAEMPIGEAIDQTETFARALLQQLEIIESNALAELESARLITTTLTQQCQAENCDPPSCWPPDPPCAWACDGIIDPIALAACEDAYNACEGARHKVCEYTPGDEACSGDWMTACPAGDIGAQIAGMQGNVPNIVNADIKLHEIVNKTLAYWVLTLDLQKQVLNFWPESIQDFFLDPDVSPMRFTRHRDILAEVPEWAYPMVGLLYPYDWPWQVRYADCGCSTIPGVTPALFDECVELCPTYTGPPEWIFPGETKIMRITDKIKEELSEARPKFLQCDIPAADYEGILSGEITAQFPVSCERATGWNVFYEGEKPCYPNNFFCLH